jgi:hypothetical protein
MYSTRIELIDLIKDAFKDVTREGGVSWHECEVIDNYGSDAERALARSRDTDRHWTELLSTEAFYPSGIGGFCFLDPIGFRYYLPAALCLSLQKTQDTVFDINALGFHLHSTVGGLPADMELFDDEQLKAIAECLWFEAAESEWGYQSDGSYIYLDDVDPELADYAFKKTFERVPAFWRKFLTPIQ